MINTRTSSSLNRVNLSTFVGWVVVLLVSLSSPDNRGCFGFVQKSTGMSRYSTIPDSSYTGKDTRATPSTTSALAATTMSTEVEAEVLTAMAHLTMDFTGLANMKPSKRLLRLLVVIGRMLVISADYVADHVIHPEELLIQLFLMSVTIKEMIVVSSSDEDNNTNADDATKKR